MGKRIVCKMAAKEAAKIAASFRRTAPSCISENTTLILKGEDGYLSACMAKKTFFPPQFYLKATI